MHGEREGGNKGRKEEGKEGEREGSGEGMYILKSSAGS